MRYVVASAVVAALLMAAGCEQKEVRRRGFTTSADRYGEYEKGHESPRWRMDMGPLEGQPNAAGRAEQRGR